jgi:hypothetical protein
LLAPQIIQFLKLLKGQHIKQHGKWVDCSCVLAPWKHDSGKDTSPSFAVRVMENGESYYNCFVCGAGKLSDLVVDLQHFKAMSLGYDVLGAWKLAEADMQQELLLDIPDWGVKEAPPPADIVRPEVWLKPFKYAWNVPYARAYLEKRNVSEAIAERLDIRWDLGMQTVCFPVRNADGDLVSMRGRFIKPQPNTASYHVYPWMDQTGGQCWLGEHFIDYDRPVLIAESVFDMTSCLRVYDNVISPMSVGINAPRIKRIQKGTEYVTLFDNGVGGDKARAIMKKHMGNAFLIQRTPPPGVGDAGDMTIEQLHDVLDMILPLAKPT